MLRESNLTYLNLFCTVFATAAIQFGKITQLPKLTKKKKKQENCCEYMFTVLAAAGLVDKKMLRRSEFMVNIGLKITAN